jgi:hypothetical protein
MSIKKWMFIGLVASLCLSSAHVKAEVITTEPLDGEHDKFCADLLSRVLNYGGGSYELSHSHVVSTQTRDVANLEKNNLDVIWIATSNDFEKRLRPIRIPLFKGLLGHRLLVVKKSLLPQLSQVESLQDLRQLRMGQGLGWVDGDILRANGFSVYDAQNHDILYSMLARGRYDALPRGLHEPWEELQSYDYPDLVVDGTLLIHYPMPMYFFVNRENTELAELIESNFERFIDDGQFEAFFYEHPKIQNAIQRAKLENRKVFRLSNPFLPEQTPLENQKYWFNPTKILPKP